MSLLNRKSQNWMQKLPSYSSPSTNQVFSCNHNNYPKQTFPSSKKSDYNYSTANFLSIYFDFAFILFLSPFRLVRDKHHGWFSIKKNIFHKIFCALQSFLGIFYCITILRTSFPDFQGNNVSTTTYFDTLGTLFNIWFQMLSLKKFWFEQDKFLSIVNCINLIKRECRQVFKKRTLKIQHKFFSKFICLVFGVMSLYEYVWKVLLAPYDTWGKTVWNRKLVSLGRYMFFMVNETESRKNVEPNDLSAWDYLLALIGALTEAERLNDIF